MNRTFSLAFALAVFGAGAAALPFRFVTTCDAQGSSESNPDPGPAFDYVISRINELSPRPDFWIFGGDAYYSATDSANAMVHWQSWKTRIDPINDIPIYLAIGNHDVNNYGHFYGPWHGDGTGPFRASWPGLPQNGPAGYVGTAYSFRYDNSMFCVVNTNTYDGASYSATYKVDATQRSWLAAVLDTATAIHKFVIGHTEAWPPSNSSSSSLEWNPADRDAFWNIMTSHDVEAYVCGHIHLWNDDYFVASGYGNAPANTSTRQVVCGGAGGSLVSGYGGNFYHFVVWDINGSSVAARVIDSYGNLRDSIIYSAGVAGEPNATAVDRPPSRIRYRHGRIYWDGGIVKGSLSVYDIAGRIVGQCSVSGNSTAWNPGLEPSGVYLVRLDPVAGGSPTIGRIVIVR
jgi:hypothetical protein